MPLTFQAGARAANVVMQLSAGLLLCGARTEAALAMGKNAAVELLHMPEVHRWKHMRERKREGAERGGQRKEREREKCDRSFSLSLSLCLVCLLSASP